MFHIRHLHLGHLAKAFALREAPTALTSGKGAKASAKAKHRTAKTSGAPSSEYGSKKKRAREVHNSDDEHDVADAEKRMEKVVREQGRLTKKGGKMVSSGTGEFQLAGGDYLDKLINGR